jgi:APA family basic amino acid/polyamine antiporter
MTIPPLPVDHPPGHQPGLRRSVGPLAASLSGIGIVLGAGIYVLVGEAAGEVGNPVWAAFLVGAVLAAATGLSYAELTSMIPESGAAAAYAEEAFGSRVGFVTGWMDVAVNVIAVPAVALGFAGYFADLIGGDREVVAALTVLACAVVVLMGVGGTVRLASVFAVIEAAGLLVVVFVGVPFLGEVNLFELDHGWAGLLTGAALVFFAYEGFEEIATLSEEIREPTKNVPRALLIAIGVTTLLYVTVAAVAVSVLGAGPLSDAAAPLARVAEQAAGERMGSVLSVVALFATFNTVLLLLATGPRAMYGMAQRRMLPAVMGRVWPARRTPWVAIVFATVMALAFGLPGDIGYVAQVTNFAVFTLFVVVNASVIRLRFSDPGRARPFRLRPEVGRVPLASLVGLAGALLLAVFMERDAFITGLVALALGIAASFAFVRPGRSRVAS